MMTFPMLLFIHLPLQAGLLQIDDFVSVASPRQGRPSPLGEGESQVLLLEDVPGIVPPHVAEQLNSAHCVQMPHPPLTAKQTLYH